MPAFTEYYTEWANLTIGAWCYYENDETEGKLYNWYAVMGIHDAIETTTNKEFAPEGWHIPSIAEWTTLENHLIANGYNYDDTTRRGIEPHVIRETMSFTINDSNLIKCKFKI